MCEALANASITPAADLLMTWLGAPSPFLKRPAVDGRQPEARHIEVKGRVQGASTVTVTRNEILYALNQADKFLLAIALVGSDDSVD